VDERIFPFGCRKMDYQSIFQDFPMPLREHLQIVYERQGRKGQGTPQQLVEIYQSLSYWDMLTESWFPKIHCYSSNGKKTIRLLNFVKDSDSVRVVEGILEGKPVVVKSILSKKHAIQDEMANYSRLKKAGCPVPWFSTKFYFWGQPVLVLEKLEPLGPYDNEYSLGIQILRQLRYVHRFGCHSDIKPQNIMKRVHDRRSNRNTEYFLIDYGGVADEPLKKGYRRWIWTRKWTCQEPHASGQVITSMHDFIELGYVMKAIQNWREQPPKKGNKRIDGNFRTGYTGRLRKYMNRVVDDHITDHRALMDILSGSK